MRKKIVIDVDETFSVLLPVMLPWHNKKFGTNYSMDSYTSYRLEQVFGHTVDHWKAEFKIFIEEEWENLSRPLEGAVDSVKKMLESHDVVFMTARDKKVHHVTERFLRKHLGGHFTELISLTYESKGKALQEIGADLLIDDRIENLHSAKKVGVEGWLYGNFKLQQKSQDEFPRVRDWFEVADKLGVELAVTD